MRWTTDVPVDISTRHRLSLADASAAALAKATKADLVTGDPDFRTLEKEIKIRWVG